MRGAVSRGAQVAGEDALLDQRDLLGHHALVIPAERAQAARDGGVGHDVAQVAAVAEGAQHVRRQEAGSRVGGLGAERAVQLRGMAAALVHLHVQLGRVQQDRACAGRQGRGGQELHGLGRGTLGVAGEVHRPDELVAGRGPRPAVVRVAATLVLVAPDRVGLEARPDVRDHLLRVGAVAGGERLPLALRAVDGLRPGDALDGVHGAVRGEQVRDLAVQGDGERVFDDRALKAAVRWSPAVQRDVRPDRGGAGARDADGLRGDAIRLGGGQVMARREAPRSADDDADAEAFALAASNTLDPAGLDADVLLEPPDHAHVGVRGSQRSRRVEGTVRDVAHCGREYRGAGGGALGR